MNNNVINFVSKNNATLDKPQYELDIIRRYAGTLMLTFNIPFSDNMVIILGHGNEKDNFEAMETWVESNLIHEEFEATIQTLQQLTNRLHTYLQYVMGGHHG